MRLFSPRYSYLTKLKGEFHLACYDGNYPVPCDPLVSKSILERRRTSVQGLGGEL